MGKTKTAIAKAKTLSRAANPCAKQRPVDDPYEIWENAATGYTVKVLKKYQSPETEESNPGARWFCHVKSPFNGEGCLEDVYAAEVKRDLTRIK